MTLRSDIETATVESRKRAKKKITLASASDPTQRIRPRRGDRSKGSPTGKDRRAWRAERRRDGSSRTDLPNDLGKLLPDLMAKKKSKIKSTGLLGDLYDYATGKKKTRLKQESEKIDDIMEDPKDKLERKLREEAEAKAAEVQDS